MEIIIRDFPKQFEISKITLDSEVCFGIIKSLTPPATSF